MKAKDITASKFLAECKEVVDRARTNGWRYGNSTVLPPCSDGIISCDRLIARALWNLGFTDQRRGGETCGSLDSYLSKHGFIRSTNFNDIRPGSIILVKHSGKNYWSHAFVMVKFNKGSFLSDRYDTGSNERIRSVQPLRNVSWGYRRDIVLVYNIPEPENKEPVPHKLTVEGQKYLRQYLGIGGIPRATGIFTDDWKQLYKKAVQTALNKEYKSGLKINGKIEQDTRLEISRHAPREGDISQLVSMLEIGFYLNNINPQGYENPGEFGKGVKNAVNFVRRKLGLKETGIAGIKTFEWLMEGKNV